MTDIRVITGPTLRLVVRPQLDTDALRDWLDQEFPGRPEELLNGHQCLPVLDDGEAIPEAAGRLCYGFGKPRPGGTAAYHRHIVEVGHGSVYHSAVYGFVISGVSRSLTHEWIRHAVGTGISQESQRYIECPGAFVLPPAMAPDLAGYERFRQQASTATSEQHKQWHRVIAWKRSCAESFSAYRSLVEAIAESAPAHLDGTARRKWARQAARSVLPECTATRLWWTANLRAIRNVLDQRASRHADEEIRRLACLLFEVMAVECPAVFSDYRRVELEQGGYELVTPNRKV